MDNVTYIVTSFEMIDHGLETAPAPTPSRPDIKLSSGRTIKHFRMANGAWDAVPSTGPDEMTGQEWNEYCDLIRDRKIPGLYSEVTDEQTAEPFDGASGDGSTIR